MKKLASALQISFLLLISPLLGQETDKTRVACVGDSITYGARVEQRKQNCYPAKLQGLLGDKYQVKNFGVSGSTMLKNGNKPYWKQKAFANAKKFKPDIVLIKLGTNDAKPRNWKLKDEYGSDYREMIKAFRAANQDCKIYLCLPTYVAGEGNFEITQKIVKDEVIPIVRAVAKETDLPVIDLYAALDGKDALIPDKVHPNAEGAAILAKTIFAAVKKPTAKDEKKAAGKSSESKPQQSEVPVPASGQER